MNILCIESFCPQKHNRTLLFCNILLKHGGHFNFSNQPLNMSKHVCYLDCHEAGLCCYLVIIYTKPITTITAVLLPFVTYLLTLLRIFVDLFAVNSCMN
jgi:hypothetical protein